MPKKSGEIALDNKAKIHRYYKLSDRVTFVNSDGGKSVDGFRKTVFKVVGFVETPKYISKNDRGASTIGTGETAAFAVIPAKDFDRKVHTQLTINFEQLAQTAAYSETYKKTEKQLKRQLEKALDSQPKERLAAIKQRAQKKIDNATRELRAKKAKLARLDAKFRAEKQKLSRAKTKYLAAKTTFQKKLQTAKKELTASKLKLGAAKAKLNQAKEKISSGSKQLHAAKQKLQQKKRQWQEAWQQLTTAKSFLTRTEKLLNQASKQNNLAVLEQNRSSLKQSASTSIAAMDLSKEEKKLLKESLDEYDHELKIVLKNPDNAELTNLEIKHRIKQLRPYLNKTKRYLESTENKLQKNKQRIDQSEKTLANKQRELTNAEQAYQAGEKNYKWGVSKYQQGKSLYWKNKTAGELKFTNMEKQLKVAQAQYQANWELFQKKKAKATKQFAKAEKNLQIEQQRLDALKKPRYYVLDRNNNPAYSEYQENANRLTSLSTIFPIFFFLIAALVCLTTMTRMIEEQRTQIGLLKALGYGKGSIVLKYLVYGSLASVLGGVTGLLIGFHFFPKIIFNAYKTMYLMPEITTEKYGHIFLVSLVVAVICTTCTAFIACQAELRANASTLMRPRAPKSGKRILLERISFIWNKLHFTSKLTARNLFRYKDRMLMTVFGVAGCTALILTGFGLRDSISNIVDKQYGNIMRYDAAVQLDETAPKTARASYANLMKNANITSSITVAQSNLDAVKAGKASQKVSIIVPKNEQAFSKFVILRDRKEHNAEKISKKGVVVSEKLAKLYHLKVGSKLYLKNATNHEYQVKVTAITENYALHYIYMSPAYYQKTFAKSPVYNLDLLNLKNTSKAWQNNYAEKLIDSKAVVLVTYSNTISSLLENTLDSLDIVMIVLILSAALLAFVVLYNLTNINISERIRELSTIKVLGFYPKEVTMYVYRENIILTVLGILLGFFGGALLHRFVISTAEIDDMMFSPTIEPWSYFYAASLTLLFAGIVMFVMHQKLKHIDMIEALKSVE